ncbi:MAG: hypothetical protein L3J36_06080 [Rhodobacteraceae bacterium]|nr:hypothetical protein [Paracoccaceae bacterium]
MNRPQPPETDASRSTPHWHRRVTSSNLDAPPVDSETAAMFRAMLYPAIMQSSNWSTLTDRLRIKGYGLAMRDGRLFLTCQQTGARVCSFRFLGMPLVDLVARIGRPIVRALPGKSGDGDILGAYPQS